MIRSAERHKTMLEVPRAECSIAPGVPGLSHTGAGLNRDVGTGVSPGLRDARFGLALPIVLACVNAYVDAAMCT